MFDAIRFRALSALRLRRIFLTPADPAFAARLQDEQFAAVRRNTPGMMLANIGNALALFVTFIGTPLEARAALWTNALLLVSGYIFLRARRRGPRAGKKRSRPSTIHIRAAINAAALGALWAAVPMLFFLEASPGARLMVISLTAGMLFGGAFALARAPLAATVFAGPIALAAAVTLIRGADPDLARIAFVLCIYTAVLLRGAYAEALSFRGRVLSQMGAEREARTDALTKLPNRLAFTDAMERELARLHRYGGGFMLLCVDIDNFKTINDRHGHPAGDQLLAQAARRMRTALRASDLVARLGGDEFAIIATEVQTREAARAVANRIVGCFDAPFQLEGRAVQGAASVGGALAPKDGADFGAIFKSADVALYQAKQSGGWRIFEPAGEHDIADAPLAEPHLRLALANRQFALVYQPILNLVTNELDGFEALLRWSHPTRGQIPPSAFLSLAEETGLIHEIGLWVAENAAAAAARFPDRFRVCVNVSATQLRRPDFARRLLEAAARAELAPSRLEIEIGERALLAGDREMEDQVRKLSRMGVSVALDDFGSGYASLAQFGRLPLKRVKIDGPLSRDVLNRRECAAIVADAARMAAGFRFAVLAEGVETREQFEWLRDHGVVEAQGYFIAPPMPLEKLEAFVANWRPEQTRSAAMGA
ncbi:putative bifunctional diguanylate cyclase/phosphodiesterase [Methylocystis parvus]|uniref:EAL domain-containing protein n=1 Tax=Methylocystis parvus TaxID=134 RepID=A0A6B8MAG8_9HYPH|nr:EAL domain-containing protein [Methylocystis parvus]QGM97650.1 EAL domain-containing protein [Methylocystis parvus]WBJ98415.1 EAL domain-containing protein [Methylocystis parvus OBBP]